MSFLVAHFKHCVPLYFLVAMFHVKHYLAANNGNYADDAAGTSEFLTFSMNKSTSILIFVAFLMLSHILLPQPRSCLYIPPKFFDFLKENVSQLSTAAEFASFPKSFTLK